MTSLNVRSALAFIGSTIVLVIAGVAPLQAADRHLPDSGLDSPVERLVFSPDGDLLLGVNARGDFGVWSVDRSRLVWRGQGAPDGGVFLDGGDSLLLRDGDFGARVVDARTGEVKAAGRHSAYPVEWLGAGPRSRHVAAVGSNRGDDGNKGLTVTVWRRHTETPFLETVLANVEKSVGAEARFGPRGRFLLVRSFDEDAYVFDLEAPEGEPLHVRHDGHDLLAFDEGGSRLLVRAQWPENAIRAIPLTDAAVEETFETPFHSPRDMLPLGASGTFLIEGVGVVGYWRKGAEDADPRLDLGSTHRGGYSLSRDGQRILVWDGETVRTASLGGEIAIVPLEEYGTGLAAAAFIPGRDGMALAMESGKVILREPESVQAEEERAPAGPRLVAQTGHAGGIVDAAMDSNRNLLASLDDNGVALLWSRDQGRQLRELEHGITEPEMIVITSDGCCTAVAGNEGRVALIDNATGERRRLLELGTDIRAMTFTSDGEGLIAAGGSGGASSGYPRVKSWSIPLGEERSFSMGGMTGPADILALSDSGEVAVGAASGRIAVFDTVSAQMLWDVSVSGDDIDLKGLAFEGPERLLVGVDQGLNGKLVRLDRSGAQSILWERESSIFGPSQMVRVGQDEWAFKLLSEWIHLDLQTGNASELSPNSFLLRHLLRDRSQGKLIGIQGNGRVRCFSPGSDGTCFHMHRVNRPSSLAFSPNGEYLAFGYDSGGLETAAALWRLDDGRTLSRLPVPGGENSGDAIRREVTHVDFTGEEHTVLIKRRLGLFRWQPLRGQSERISEFERMTNDRNPAPGVAKGRYAFCHEGYEVVVREPLNDGKPVKVEPHYAGAPPVPSCMATAISADARWLIVATNAGARLQAWSLNESGEPDDWKVLRQGDEVVTAIQAVGDGAQFFVAWSDGRLERLDAATGQTVEEYAGDGTVVTAIDAERASDRLLIGKRDGTIQTRRLTSGSSEGVLDAGAGAVTSLALAPGGTQLFSAHETGDTILWDLETGEEMARLIRFTDGGWAAVTPDGRYDASDPGDLPGLHWILPDAPFEAVPVSRFYRDYYEPRLVPRLLAGETFPPVTPPADVNRVVPKVEIVSVEQEAESRVAIEVAVESVIRRGRVSGVSDLKLFRDGRLVATSPRGQALVEEEGRQILRFEGIRLPRGREPGETIDFTAYAFNSSGIKSATARHPYRPPPPSGPVKRRAVVIAIGINAHENPSWNLRYAAADARANADLITARLEQTGRFDVVHSVRLIADGADSLVSRDEIEAVFSRLAGGDVHADSLAGIPGAEGLPHVSPDDFIYVSFAGHGYAGENGMFHLFLSDIGKPKNGATRHVDDALLDRTLSSDRLSRLLHGIDAGAMTFVVDACNAAASVEGGGFKPGPMGSRGLGQLAYDKAMRILAASQAEAVALESERLRHGALTFAMLREGLQSGEADRAPSDGRITFDELLRYGVDRVPELYTAIKNNDFEPQGRGAVSLFDPDIAADGSETDLDALSGAQQPALFDFRRNVDADIAVPVP